jgi:hypothetical protein
MSFESLNGVLLDDGAETSDLSGGTSAIVTFLVVPFVLLMLLSVNVEVAAGPNHVPDKLEPVSGYILCQWQPKHGSSSLKHFSFRLHCAAVGLYLAPGIAPSMVRSGLAIGVRLSETTDAITRIELNHYL